MKTGWIVMKAGWIEKDWGTNRQVVLIKVVTRIEYVSVAKKLEFRTL